jgi:hypothetical protein
MARVRKSPPIRSEYLDTTSRKFYVKQQKQAKLNMAEFDALPSHVRAIEHAVGNIRVARMLALDGIMSAEEAEPIVRGMLMRRFGRTDA